MQNYAKKSCVLSLATTCLCLAVVSTVHADAKFNARRAIQAAYNHYDEAMHEGDLDDVLEFKASGYTSIDEQGNITTDSDEELHQHFARILTPPNKTTEHKHITGLVLQGSGAIVTVISQEDAVRQDPATGQFVAHHIEETDRDFWVNTNGQWKWKRSKTLTISVE